MAATTRGRSKSAAVNRELLETAGSFLETLPEKPKEEMSLREAMKHLREPIQAALAKGYNYPDLAEVLAQQGIRISATTLKNYVPTGKRQAAKEKKAAIATTKSKRGRQSKARAEDELATDSEIAEAFESNGASSDAITSSSTGGRKSASTTKSASATRTKTSTRPSTKATGGRRKKIV